MRGVPDGEPAVQSSYMKNLVSLLEKRGVAAELRQVDAELFDAIEAASRMSWLPAAMNVRMVEVMAERFGEARGLELLTDCLYAQFETPLWKNFVGGAVRLLGTNPGSLGRWIPQAYRLVFRCCGKWSTRSPDATTLEVVASEMPLVLASHELWLRSVAAGIGSVFRLCEMDGRSRLREVDTVGGRATFELTWKSS